MIHTAIIIVPASSRIATSPSIAVRRYQRLHGIDGATAPNFVPGLARLNCWPRWPTYLPLPVDPPIAVAPVSSSRIFRIRPIRLVKMITHRFPGDRESSAFFTILALLALRSGVPSCRSLADLRGDHDTVPAGRPRRCLAEDFFGRRSHRRRRVGDRAPRSEASSMRPIVRLISSPSIHPIAHVPGRCAISTVYSDFDDSICVSADWLARPSLWFLFGRKFSPPFKFRR